MVSAVTVMALRVFGLGAVLAAVSEVWFYPITLEPRAVWLCLFYGLFAYTVWLVIAQTKVSTWAGAFWGACLFGFCVEGIPVPVLYEAVPFTILWTSIAWHAIISVALGLWMFRVLMARCSILMQLMCLSLSGVYLGAWSVELWSLQIEGDPWTWVPTATVATQMLVGWVMFVLGHIALDLSQRMSTVPMRYELVGFAIMSAAMFVLGPLIVFFPMSVLLPVLVAISVLVMRKDGQGHANTASPFLVRLSALRISMQGYILSLIIPLAACATYWGLERADARLESAALHIMWAGPISITLVVWSIWKIWTRPAAVS